MAINIEDQRYALDVLINDRKLTDIENEQPAEALAKARNKTNDWAIRHFDDVIDRKRLGHLNSIADTPRFSYEGINHFLMPEQWEDGLLALPPRVIDDIGHEHFQDLLQGFHVERGEKDFSWDSEKNQISEEGQRILDGKTVVLSYGTSSHAVDVIFQSGYVLICNAGFAPEGCRSESNIVAYKVAIKEQVIEFLKKSGQEYSNINEEEFNEELNALIHQRIQNFLQRAQESKNDTDPNSLFWTYEEVKNIFGNQKDKVCEILETLSKEKQTVGNCSSVSRSIALLGALALKGAQGDTLSLNNVEKAKRQFERISAHVQAYPLNKYYLMREQKEEDGVFDSYLVGKCLHNTVEHLKRAGVSTEFYPEIENAYKSTTTIQRIFHRAKLIFSDKK